MEYPVQYVLTGATGVEASGEGRGHIDADTLSIRPTFGEALWFSLRDFTEVSAGDYRVRIGLTSNEELTLSGLGYKYEDFVRVLSRFRNEMIVKDLLMEESLKKSEVPAEFHYQRDSGAEGRGGGCKVRLYETALVLIPEEGEVLRIPYCYLSSIREQDHALVLEMDTGETLVLSRLGKQLDPFGRVLSEAMNNLSLKAQRTLRELAPDVDPAAVRKGARLMKDGLAARRRDIEAIDPALWRELEERIGVLGLDQEYAYLESLAQKDRMCIGLKRGLMGDLTGEYLWFLIPMYSLDPAEGGNLVAMESRSTEGGGGATYFFRLVGREAYTGFTEIDELHAAADAFITTMNRCMLAVNFRREPIYLPAQRLSEPRYEKYRTAVSRIPELRTLRDHFVGRVVHRSFEQWQSDVTELMDFNTTATTDSARWTKAGPEGGAEDAGLQTSV